MQKKLKWISLLIAAVMMMAAVTPVFADTGDVPVDEPVVEEPSSFEDHPIVKLLAGFFASLFNPPAREEPVDGGTAEPPVGEGGADGGGETPPDGEPVEGDPVDEPPVPTVVPEAVVAALHEQQHLGFGEMTKLFQLAAEAQAACALEGVNCDVTLDGLIAEFKAGVGMGDLFQKYGKPENLGVGHIRKAADPKDKSNNGNANGKNK
jgi:hypothetical protein